MKGMGKNPALVIMGFKFEILEVIKDVIKVGRSSAERARKELEEFIIWARMIRINDERPDVDVEGFVKVMLKKDVAQKIKGVQLISHRVRDTLEDIKITMKRIKK